MVGEEADTATQAEFLDKENDKDFKAVFKGNIERQTHTEHYIGNMIEHFLNKDARHEINLRILYESHHFTRIGLIAGALVRVFGMGGIVLIIINKCTLPGKIRKSNHDGTAYQISILSKRIIFTHTFIMNPFFNRTFV